MTNNEIYDFIGELAIALYSKKIQISLGSLRIIMLDKGKDYVNNRGMASAVSAAYRRWKEKDPVIYYAIAYTYTDKEGNLAWDEQKKTIVEKDADPVAESASAAEGNEAEEISSLGNDAEAEEKEESLAEPEKEEVKEEAEESAAEEAGDEKPEKEEVKEKKAKKAPSKKAPSAKKTQAKKK